MSFNMTRARQLLATADLRTLFIDALGWDRHSAALEVPLQITTYKLSALAHKRGMVAYHCPTPTAQRLPDYNQRRQIEHQVAKSTHEHLIVFTDAANETQIWQWVKRELGKPAACREHAFHRSQSGDGLLQKIGAIAFSLDEEERLSLVDVASRARAGFDVEKITKRFYDRFQKEHTAFLKFIKGITQKADHEWYASVMLNRLMFVYFVQRKGFLDGDQHYLRNRLNQMREGHGKDKFYSFYRYFLLRLFHEGLGGRKRSAELEKLIGRIPYLNGGLFDVHELERPERYGKSIQIPDQAFEHIFDYFDQYQWHLDERPLRADNEINPDVLGYIFEKYINQKQMGAYYTKEDITEYISKNTVLPFLLDTARIKCKVAFENPKGPTVWDLLKDDPDRYIYPAMRHGVTWGYQTEHHQKGMPLEKPYAIPEDIASGLNPPTLHQVVSDGPVLTLELRKEWNKSAQSTHALPTETWREVIARRMRYQEIKSKLAAGEIRNVNDLITFNLDIRQFAQDILENCEGPDLLRAFWHAIEKVTILDPTCGSGAFLFAALNILEPLYEACLDRMQAFVEDLDRSGDKHRPEKFSDFRKVLEHVSKHPNRRYFIFKSIILNNLYGVDIMEEAVEICKLRLFLKLAAQVSPDKAKQNLGVEPLPDIDFNIRAGNTLVGYANFDEVLKSAEGDWLKQQDIAAIKVRAADLQQVFDTFRARQVEGDGSVPSDDKQELRKRLMALEKDLNSYLASTYGVACSKRDIYAKWQASHQPFHWFIEFYGIVNDRCGFDIIIGNPPYYDLKQGLDYSVKNYTTLSTKNLYPLILERCIPLARSCGRIGLIVPVSSISTEGYSKLQELILELPAHLSSYDDRPSRLFDGLEHIQLTIHLLEVSRRAMAEHFVTECYRWSAIERPYLFPMLQYESIESNYLPGCIPKLSSKIEHSIVRKVWLNNKSLGAQESPAGEHEVFYSRKVHNFLQVLDFVPKVYDGKGRLRAPSELKALKFRKQEESEATFCLLNSTLFRWFVNVFSDCRHVNKREVEGFRCDLDALLASETKRIDGLAKKLSKSLKETSEFRRMKFKHDHLRVQCIIPRFSKRFIDDVDALLAKHYRLSEEELDFIVNYDIKYRMGRDAEDEEA